MAKYIDADLFLKRLGLAPADWCKGQTVKYALDNTPAADVAPVVHGEWKFCGADRWNDAYQCSECGKIATDDSNYCPNCGADMRGANHE